MENTMEATTLIMEFDTTLYYYNSITTGGEEGVTLEQDNYQHTF